MKYDHIPLGNLKDAITFYEKLNTRYPDNPSYKDNLAKLQQALVDEVDKIGRKRSA